MKKLAIISPNDNIQIENLEGDWLEMWERGAEYWNIGGLVVRQIDDLLMIVDEEEQIVYSAKSVLEFENALLYIQ